MPSIHGRVNALERALRSRNRLLEDPRPDPHWLDAIEHETAELAVAVAAAARRDRRRGCKARSPRATAASAFPAGRDRARRLDGAAAAARIRAAEIEDRYRALLHDNRARDAAAGRTLDGPHLTDLAVTLRRQGHCRRRRLDRRAEGAADRSRARACRADRRHDRLCAGAAARRGRRPSRSGAPRRALRRARRRSARRSG